MQEARYQHHLRQMESILSQQVRTLLFMYGTALTQTEQFPPTSGARALVRDFFQTMPVSLFLGMEQHAGMLYLVSRDHHQIIQG